MGGIASVATTAIQALNTVNTVVKAFDKYDGASGSRAYDQTKELQKVQMQSERERTALEKEQIRLTGENAESERRAALRRAVARQRAQYGASGTGSADGSAQAVLLGLFDESDEERTQRESLDALKTGAINQNLAQQKRINTLQLTQMKERDRLKKYSSAFDFAGTLGGIIL